MEKITYKILTGKTTDYHLPILLESSVDEMGIMVGFDGDIEQIEQFCNFTYLGDEMELTIINSLNTNKLKTLIDSVFTISWGDKKFDTLSMPTVYMGELPQITHTYKYKGMKKVEITITSPWEVKSIVREVYVPFPSRTNVITPNCNFIIYGDSYIIGTTPTPTPTPLITEFMSNFGTLVFNVPYTDPVIRTSQTYLQDYSELTGNTEDTTISFLAVGKSRIDEFKKYGKSNQYVGVVFGSTEAGDYTGYTIDNLFYMDYSDGYTHITGLTSSFLHEELYDGMITRNEHLIGFLDDPTIFSDIFVERGKQGIMEHTLRLGEVDSIGELDIYGSGYFKVKKQ